MSTVPLDSSKKKIQKRIFSCTYIFHILDGVTSPPTYDRMNAKAVFWYDIQANSDSFFDLSHYDFLKSGIMTVYSVHIYTYTDFYYLCVHMTVTQQSRVRIRPLPRPRQTLSVPRWVVCHLE